LLGISEKRGIPEHADKTAENKGSIKTKARRYEMNKQHKTWIDKASYEQMLHRWRFAPAKDKIFQGDTGTYYCRVMREKREKIDPVAASENVGWLIA